MFTNKNRTDWPIITKKHDDIAQAFMDRMARDQCSPQMTWNYTPDDQSIASVTVHTATANRCRVPIPVTIPVNAKSIPKGATTEQIGSDSLTIWVKMEGSPVTIQLAQPVAL
jgi:hypothetical protein